MRGEKRKDYAEEEKKREEVFFTLSFLIANVPSII